MIEIRQLRERNGAFGHRRRKARAKNTEKEGKGPDPDWGITQRFGNGNYRATLSRLASDLHEQLADVKDGRALLYKAAYHGTPFLEERKLPVETEEATDRAGRIDDRWTALRSDAERFIENRSRALHNQNADGWPDTAGLRQRVEHLLNSRQFYLLASRLKEGRNCGELVEGKDWFREKYGHGKYAVPPYHYNPETVIPWLLGKRRESPDGKTPSDTGSTGVAAAESADAALDDEDLAILRAAVQIHDRGEKPTVGRIAKETNNGSDSGAFNRRLQRLQAEGLLRNRGRGRGSTGYVPTDRGRFALQK